MSNLEQKIAELTETACMSVRRFSCASAGNVARNTFQQCIVGETCKVRNDCTLPMQVSRIILHNEWVHAEITRLCGTLNNYTIGLQKFLLRFESLETARSFKDWQFEMNALRSAVADDIHCLFVRATIDELCCNSAVEKKLSNLDLICEIKPEIVQRILIQTRQRLLQDFTPTFS